MTIEDLFAIFFLWAGIAEIWQYTEIALYGYTQESVVDAICAFLLAFFIVKEIVRNSAK